MLKCAFWDQFDDFVISLVLTLLVALVGHPSNCNLSSPQKTRRVTFLSPSPMSSTEIFSPPSCSLVERRESFVLVNAADKPPINRSMSDCHQPPYRWAPLSAPAQGKFLWGPAGESSTVCPNGVSKHESGGRLSPCPRSFWSHGSGAVVNLQRLHSAEPRCLILRACLALPHLGLRISIASDCWELGAQSGWCSGGGRRRAEVRAVFTLAPEHFVLLHSGVH